MATYLQYADDSFNIDGEYPTGIAVGGRMRVVRGTFVQTATTIAQLVLECELPRIPAGKIMVLPQLSWLRADDADANAVLKIGYRAYTNSSLVAVVEDDDFWMTAAAVGAGALQGLWPAITGITAAGARPTFFDTVDGLRIFVKIETAMPNAADVIDVAVVYVTI